ncbi:MAG TPA: T9SS type A sorting domain-containing protein, partial [Chitinophagales bacterium]|nr:T9SS type A sorting domain-containing protein [Chitinophagales bacterium]
NFTTPAPPEGCWWRTENEPLDTLNEHDLNLLTTCTPSIVYNNSKLNIILENNSCQDVNYSLFIFNILGQRVDVIRISENYDMEISSKPSGVYIAILVAESGKILSTAKFYK